MGQLYRFWRRKLEKMDGKYKFGDPASEERFHKLIGNGSLLYLKDVAQ